MTAIADRHDGRQLWGTMPGWGIVADLTPDELVESRQLKLLRTLVMVGLGVVVALCGLGYGYAYLQQSSASDSLDAVHARTTMLTAQQSKYVGVTRLQNATDGINAQIKSLTANDIESSVLLNNLRRTLPGSMSLTSVSVTTSGAPTVAGSASLDTSGHAQIGTVTLAGSAQSLDDLPTYVSALSRLKGVANVIPSSNTIGDAGAATWTVTLQLTDELYTHDSATATSTNGGQR